MKFSTVLIAAVTAAVAIADIRGIPRGRKLGRTVTGRKLSGDDDDSGSSSYSGDSGDSADTCYGKSGKDGGKGGKRCKGQNSISIGPDECDVCSRGNSGKGKGGGGSRSSYLELRYNADDADSMYQGSKGTCHEQHYPDETTVIVNRQIFPVETGTSFTVMGPFGASTDFEIRGYCEFHSSCSVPLIVKEPRLTQW